MKVMISCAPQMHTNEERAPRNLKSWSLESGIDKGMIRIIEFLDCFELVFLGCHAFSFVITSSMQSRERSA